MADDIDIHEAERPYSPAAAISSQMVQLFAKYLGRGPSRARTTLNTNVVLVAMEKTMTRAEQNLVVLGEAERVRSLRRTLQHSMRDEAVAMIEDLLARQVVAYTADLDTDADIAVVAFILEPLPESGRVEVADA